MPFGPSPSNNTVEQVVIGQYLSGNGNGSIDGQSVAVIDGQQVAVDPTYINPLLPPYNIKFDRVTYLTASIAAGSRLLSINGYNFTPNDIGKKVKVTGAGIASNDLKTAIIGNSGNYAILETPASTTVSNAFVIVATDNIVGLQLLANDLSYTGRDRKFSRAAILPEGVAAYSGTLLLHCHGLMKSVTDSWNGYDLMYSRFAGAENHQGAVLYQLWDNGGADAVRVRSVGPTQFDWNGRLEGVTFTTDLDNTSGNGLVYKTLAGTAVKVIDGGTLERVACLGFPNKGIHFAGGSITATFKELQAFACGWNGRVTFTADTTSGSNVLTNVSSTDGLSVNDILSGPNIPIDSTINSIVPGVSVTIKYPATTTAVGNQVEKLGDPGILYEFVGGDTVHFDGPSGDQNSGGLVRAKGSGTGSEASLKFTNIKHEFGVNVYRGGPYNVSTPSIPQGLNVIVLDGMVNTPVTIDTGVGWADANSSVGGTMPNPLGKHIGAFCLSLASSKAPDVTWNNVRVKLATGSGQTTRVAFRDNWSTLYIPILSDSTGKDSNKPKPPRVTTLADSSTTLGIYNQVVSWTTLTVSRNCVLPSIADVAVYYEITLIDSGGNATAGRTITAVPSGADTIVNTSVINSAYGRLRIVSDGTKWIGYPD